MTIIDNKSKPHDMVIGKKSNDRDRVETINLDIVLHMEDSMVFQVVDCQIIVVMKRAMETKTKDDLMRIVEKIHEGIKEGGLRHLIEKIHKGIKEVDL